MASISKHASIKDQKGIKAMVAAMLMGTVSSRFHDHV
jgi:hypothetical protein